MDYPNLNAVPLVIVAAEVGATADELAQRFGDAVTLDAAGLRCVPTERARSPARRPPRLTAGRNGMPSPSTG